MIAERKNTVGKTERADLVTTLTCIRKIIYSKSHRILSLTLLSKPQGYKKEWQSCLRGPEESRACAVLTEGCGWVVKEDPESMPVIEPSSATCQPQGLSTISPTSIGLLCWTGVSKGTFLKRLVWRHIWLVCPWPITGINHWNTCWKWHPAPCPINRQRPSKWKQEVGSQYPKPSECALCFREKYSGTKHF